MSEVTLDDWDRANGWKIPSLIRTSLDAGLRPIEVERSVVERIDTENGCLRIPEKDSSKNRDNWIVSLTDRTAEALALWLEEREQHQIYEESDNVWLTRQGNPYTSNSLNRVLISYQRLLTLGVLESSGTRYALRRDLHD